MLWELALGFGLCLVTGGLDLLCYCVCFDGDFCVLLGWLVIW